jgi:hypothetical protein
MSADADQPSPSNGAERKFARDAGTVWGLILDHLVDKHVGAAAAMKINPEGGVARTPDGVVVTSKELVQQVLLNADGNYTIEGYQERMEKSIGVIYLGMDWSPEYERQSTPANAAIGRVSRREAFDLAVKETRAALATVPAPNGIVDIQAVSDVVFAKLCAYWFDIPDGVHVKAGGFRISNLFSDGVCPGDYSPPSGYIVHPDPDFLLTLLGQRTGQILRESVNKYVDEKRAAGQVPTAALTRAFFEEFPDPKDNDVLARTIVGVMMGALPTINGNLVTIVKTWQRTATLLALQAKLNASKETDEFVKAHQIVEPPMRETMQMQPTPDWLWRKAKKDHTLGTKNPVQVHAGDKIYLSIAQATQEELRGGGNDICPLFGGDRSKSPHPTHACPGFEMGFGILLGIVYAVVDFQPTP